MAQPDFQEYQEAFQAVLDGSESDIEGFLCRWFSAGETVNFIVDHIPELRERGLLEKGLLWAWINANSNFRNWTLGFTQGLFSLCDRDRLLAAGQPLPAAGPFALYRGVAGTGAARRKRGLSWTSSIARARWFAARFVEPFNLAAPTVYRAVVERNDILAYSNERQEEEYLVLLTANHKIELLERLSEYEVAECLEAESRAQRELAEARLALMRAGK